MNLTDAARLARELIAQHGLTGFPSWRFQFDRARRRFGYCSYSRRLISLSAVLTRLNTESEVRDTLLHEIAHALAGPGHGHGATWKAKCRAIGARPVRCYSTAGTEGFTGSAVVVPRKTWRGTCPTCGTTLERFRRRTCSCARCSNGRFNAQHLIQWRRA